MSRGRRIFLIEYVSLRIGSSVERVQAKTITTARTQAKAGAIQRLAESARIYRSNNLGAFELVDVLDVMPKQAPRTLVTADEMNAIREWMETLPPDVLKAFVDYITQGRA